MATKAGKTGLGAGLIFCSAALYYALGGFEGEKEFTVYADQLAGGLPSVCRGLTKHVTSTPIVIGERWSKSKCEAEEKRAIVALQQKLLSRCFDVTPPQSVFDAATSHAWNFGPAATCGSEAMKAWNAGDWATGCRRLQFSDGGKPVWSYIKAGVDAEGKPIYQFVRGLAIRRAAERAMCEGRQ